MIPWPGLQGNHVVAFIPQPALRTGTQQLRLLVEQENGQVSRMEIAVRYCQDSRPDLIELKSREHSLARVVQGRDFSAIV